MSHDSDDEPGARDFVPAHDQDAPQLRAKGKVRFVDIAEAVGVSRATVSLALRHHPSISETTRERVANAARELGYIYNRGAANLRTASTQTIGIVVHDVTNPYFAEITAALQEEMNERGRVVLFGNTDENLSRQSKIVETFREYNVDGIVLCPAAGTDPGWLNAVIDQGMPVVLFSRDIPEVAVDWVGGDNRAGMHKATGHLLALGHRRIAMIGANRIISTGQERLQGYHDALVQYGVRQDPSLILEGPATRDEGMAQIRALLATENPPTAAVCFNDILAFGAMLGLRRLGLEPGRDFSVVGFDDVAEATLWRPALTSVGFSPSQLGRKAVELLIRRLSNAADPSVRVAMPLELHVRESCGAHE